MSDDFWQRLGDHGAVQHGVALNDLVRRAFGQVYVATPYSHRVRDAGPHWLSASMTCALEAATVCEALASRGVAAVSPIVQAHAMIAARLDRGEDSALLRAWALDAGFWTRYCTPILSESRFLYVPDLPGWRGSVGIRVEVDGFLRWSRPVMIEAAL